MSRTNSDIAVYEKKITDLINTLKREMWTLSYVDDFQIMALKAEKIKGLSYIRGELTDGADIENIIQKAKKDHAGLTVSFIFPSRVEKLLNEMCQPKSVHVAQSFLSPPLNAKNLDAQKKTRRQQEEMGQCCNVPF